MLRVADRDARQSLGDCLVTSTCDVLIAQRRTGCAVTETAHEFGERGTRCGGEYRTGVPEVVNTQIVPVRAIPRLVKHAIEGGRGKMSSGVADRREQQSLLPFRHVSFQVTFDD